MIYTWRWNSGRLAAFGLTATGSLTAKVELASLSERVSDGIHTLLTAQRRMGKTSLVRELLRRLADGDDYETLFVDFEDAETAEDAVAELAFQAEALQSTSRRIRAVFANVLRGLGQNVEELAVSELRVKFRAGIDAGTWRRRGDEVFGCVGREPEAGDPRHRRASHFREPSAQRG